MNNLKTNVLYPFLLMGLVVLLYHSVIHNGVSGLDDIIMIEENWDKLTSLTHIYTAFTDDVFSKELGAYYRPIQILTYMPDAFISNSEHPNWQIFFIINGLIFGSAIVMLYFFLRTLKFSSNFSLIFSVFFIIHPALVPAVAWIPGRVDTVLFIFIIASIWAYIKHLQTHNWTWLSIHFLFFTLGMFTKETTVVVPVIIILYGIVYKVENDTLELGSWLIIFKVMFWKQIMYNSYSWMKRHISIVLIWLGIFIIWFILRKNALPDEQTTFTGTIHHLATSWQQLIVMFSVLLLPFNLQVFLELTWSYIWIALPGLGLFLLLPQILRTEKKYMIFGTLWIFLFILPTTLSDYVNYHRLFIPLVGMAFILKPLSDWFNSNQKVKFIIPILFALFFIYENLQFQKAFINRTLFWTNAATYSPNSAFANNGLAWSYHLDHKNDSALLFYQRVVEIRPDRENVRMGMALIQEEIGNTHLADSLMQAEFIATKDSASVYFYIGQIELERKDTIAAIKNLTLGFPTTQRSRNARMYYDTLNRDIKLRLDLQSN
jgi:hypothetical protein